MPSVTISSTLARSPDAVAVGIDVLRASTTAVTAVASGHPCYVVSTPDCGLRLAALVPGAVLAGERYGVMPPGYLLQNSPTAVLALPKDAAPIVLVSTAGTPLFVQLASSSKALVVSLRNITSTADALHGWDTDVVIVPAARRGQVRLEDRLACAMLGTALAARGFAAVPDTHRLVAQGCRSLNSICRGRSAKYLRRTGQGTDLEFVLDHVDDLDIVTVLQATLRDGVDAYASVVAEDQP